MDFANLKSWLSDTDRKLLHSMRSCMEAVVHWWKGTTRKKRFLAAGVFSGLAILQILAVWCCLKIFGFVWESLQWTIVKICELQLLSCCHFPIKQALLIVVIAILFVIILCLFLHLLRNVCSGIVLSAAMLLFGILVYFPKERTSPKDLSAESHPFVHGLAVVDNALSSFFMSRGDYSLDEQSNGKPSPFKSPLAYYLFHTLCYAYGAAFLCNVFGRRLVNILWLLLFHEFLHNRILRRKRSLVVFWGAGQETISALRKMLDSSKNGHGDSTPRPDIVVAIRRNVPFSLKRERTKEEQALDSISIHWVYVPTEGFNRLGRIFKTQLRCLEKAVRHYFLGPDSQSNVETANELMSQNVNPLAQFFLRIDSDSEQDVLFKWADGKAMLSGGASATVSPEIVLIHEPSLVASKWMAKYPANEEAQGSELEGVRLLIVGFGALGKAIFRETVQSCIRPGKHFSATILDRSASAFEPFKPFWDNLKNDEERPAETAAFCIGDAQFGFVEKDVTAPEFWNFLFRLRDQAPNATHSPEIGWTRIVFALPDDLTNLRLAAEFNRQIRSRNLPERTNSQVFAGVRDAGNMAYAKSAFANENILLFGNLEDIYADLGARLVTEDFGARFLNWRYANQDVPAYMFSDAEGFKAWRTASFFDKESSRSAVAGLRTLARKVGFVPCDNHDHDALSGKTLEKEIDAEISRRTKDEIRSLAEIEHLRWCAFLLLRRIRPWYPKDGEIMALSRQRNGSSGVGKENPVKENDQKENLRHAALVPFDKLPEVAARFEAENESVVQYKSKIDTTDVNFVRSMGEVLAATGWSFKRKP